MTCEHPADRLLLVDGTQHEPDHVECLECREPLGTLSDWGAGVPMQPVVSSNVASIGYHPHLKFFRIDFKNGTRYGFFPVPEEIWNELKRPDGSVGKAFASLVKSKFAGVLVRREQTEGTKP